MDYFNIGVIASYNIRLLLREKLLWCYTLGVYVVILFAQLSSQSVLMRNSSDIADFSSYTSGQKYDKLEDAYNAYQKLLADGTYPN